MPPTVALRFNKRFANDSYELLFNSKSGLEILRGINGHEDPFVLELPSLLDIGIMGTCKHKCPFCYQGHTNKPNMKFGHFKTIIDQVKHHTNQVALGGRGDPNKHPQFQDIVEYCVMNGVTPNYTTSGIHLSDYEIAVSTLCGAVAVSDYEQDYTYKALDRLIEAGIKTNIHQIYNNQTHIKCISLVTGYVPHFWNFDVSRLNAVIFLLFKPQGAGKNVAHLSPTEAQIEWMAANIFTPQSQFKVGMDSCFVNHLLDYAKPTELQRMSIDTCEAGRMSGYITPDMKFKPCSFAEETTEIDLLETSIEKAWKRTDPFQNFREILYAKSNCCPIGL
jgi:MoaA/NifB/PqqE/SkfB family radical SAM enzyme